MLSLFPVHRASSGIGVSARALSLVAFRRLPFCRPTVTRASQRALQEGWITPSTSSHHIVRLDALQEELRVLTASLSDRTVAISLPDESASMAVFTFDTMSKDPQERDTVIRWRFQQEADVKVGHEPLVYRLFPGEKTVSVLAAAVNQAVLKQYLALFDACRLLPVSIGFETFQVFDAFRKTMEAGPERFFVHYNGQSLTFLAFVDGRPVFMRKRRVTAPGDHVRDELFVTLQYFDDRFPYRKSEERASKLYFVDTSPATPSMERPFETRTMVTVPAVHHARSVEVLPLNWNALHVNRGKAELSNALLPAVAGIGIA